VVPSFTVTGAGSAPSPPLRSKVTSTGTEVTVTVAVPYLVGSSVETAFTVSEVAVSLAAIVSTPAEEIVVPILLLPDTLQVTVCAGLPVPVTVAENGCWVLFLILAVDGDTLTLVTVGGGGVLPVYAVRVYVPL